MYRTILVPLDGSRRAEVILIRSRSDIKEETC